MKLFHFATAGALGFLASTAGACASRDVPQHYPKSSPASPEAAEAPPAVVTRALDSEPPLSGTSTEGGPTNKPAHDHSKDRHAAEQPKPAPEQQKHDHGAQDDQ